MPTPQEAKQIQQDAQAQIQRNKAHIEKLDMEIGGLEKVASGLNALVDHYGLKDTPGIADLMEGVGSLLQVRIEFAEDQQQAAQQGTEELEGVVRNVAPFVAGIVPPVSRPS